MIQIYETVSTEDQAWICDKNYMKIGSYIRCESLLCAVFRYIKPDLQIPFKAKNRFYF